MHTKAVLVRVVPETVFDVSIVFFDEHATVFLIEEYFSLRSKKTMEWQVGFDEGFEAITFKKST